MAIATLKVIKCTGTSAATETDATGNLMRLMNADSTSQTDGANPIAVPATGTNYSFENWYKFKVVTAPDNEIATIKVWGPNTQPNSDTKLTLYLGTTATGATPVATASTVAVDRIDSGASEHNSQATALAVGTPQASDKLTAVNHETDFIVVQMKVEPAAVGGEGPVQTLSISYDES